MPIPMGTRPRTSAWPWVIALLFAACGDGATGGASLETSVATASAVRGGFAVSAADGSMEPVGRTARVALGGSAASGADSLTRLVLDSGPALLLDSGATVQVPEDARIAVTVGRIYFDVLTGDVITIDVAGSTLRASDASVSVTSMAGTDASVYVVRGEVSYRTGDTRGIVRAGEALAITGTTATLAPEALWSDWTGGLVRTGPSDPRSAPGMGTLEARVPDEVGQARWPLVIRRLDVQVRIVGELAITEVQEVFFNPASETVEGLYRVRVPEGAVLERFAVDRNGQMVDGYVREEAQARAAYEAQVYRGSTLDPALLEWDAPGSYRARIYPIVAGELRRIAIRYAEWLPRAYEGGPLLYRYPMAAGAGAPHLGELAFVADVSAAGASRIRAGLGATVDRDRVELRRSDFSPRSDLWMEIVPAAAEAQLAYRAAHEPPARAPGSRIVVNEADERDYWYLPLRLPHSLFTASDASAASGLDVVIVADVSAATDRAHLELGRSVAESIAAHLGPDDRVSIVSSDLAIRAVDGSDTALGAASPDRVDALLDGLARVPAAGATDLGAAITEAAALLDPSRDGAVIYIGDGAPTVGELGADELLGHLRDQPHAIRLYAVAVGADANLDLLGELTHGGGLAMRVEERDDAADAAMDILAHLSRPVLTGVTVELGSGIENAFPRVPTDVVEGALFEVVGRVREAPPVDVIVRGTFRGTVFEHHVSVATAASEASADLRLRWANQRLHQQLREGATREEIAELGTRYGLITPYTSYYVPSANELSQMGPTGRLYLHPDLVPSRSAPTDPGHVLAEAMITVALGPLSLSGCALSEQAAPPGEAPPPPPDPQAAVVAMQQAESGDHADQDPHMAREEAREPGRFDDGPAGSAPVTAPPRVAAGPAARATATDTTTTEAAPPATAVYAGLDDLLAGGLGLDGTGRGGGGTGEGTIGIGGNIGPIGHGSGTGSGSGYGRGARGPAGRSATVSQVRTGEAEVRGALSAEVIRRVVRRHINEVRYCYEQQLSEQPDLAGRVSIAFAISANGTVLTSAVAETTLDNAIVPPCIAAAVRRWSFPVPEGGGIVAVTYPFMLDPGEDRGDDGSGDGGYVAVGTTSSAPAAPTAGHARSRCGDAASLALADRVALWTERLAAAGYVGSWIEVYRQAIRDCEIANARDRRAFLLALIDRAGSLSSMIDVYSYLTDASARGFLRNAIFRRVRTPEDLRIVRGAFGTSDVVDWVLVEQVLARATTPAARLRALRGLIVQQPGSFDLQLRLLEELETQNRLPELSRLAARMRVDPLADAGVRTAIGELYLRRGSTEDARRTFSEIVEFAPLDELARRRLGDLYRAHGWYEDAYRQYETLATIRPDDPTVLLLLAQAAAGAHRTDEALRLEQRVMETAAPGVREGNARTAQLWSSVRFAELREAARQANDQTQLAALLSRMRRSGVLRGAGAMRVSLVWEHPDAGIALWAGHPGASLTRPADLDAELGIEAFDVVEAESGVYRVEVRRTSSDRVGTVSARLVIVWSEGREDEHVQTETLTFAPGVRALAWTLSGTTVATAAPTPIPAPVAGARAGRRPPG